MSPPFSNQAGSHLLASIRQIFEEKKVFHRHDRFFLFVCGGRLGEGDTSLRKAFLRWAEVNLPEFVCLLAEDALKDSFVGEGRAFVNLGKFETIIADVADCVLIFPESAGSFAETGFFANSKVSKKTLVVNPLTLQTVDSFLNLGPIESIDRSSFLRPTVLINVESAADFRPVAERLRERVKWPEHRERIAYQKFGAFNFKEKLLIVFEILRLLGLANLKMLRHVLTTCFGGSPNYQEIKHLLRILLAARYIERQAEYFRPVTGLKLIEIEHLEIEKIFAQVQFYYQKHPKDIFNALMGANQ